MFIVVSSTSLALAVVIVVSTIEVADKTAKVAARYPHHDSRLVPPCQVFIHSRSY